MRKTTCGWRAISDETWERCCALADERDALSAKASNTRPWNPRFNLVGVLGEELYGSLTGLPVNRKVAIRDGGFDFPGLDVKTSTRHRNPELLLSTTSQLKASLYALVALDLDGRRARLCGYATREMVQRAGTVNYGKGRPPAYRLTEADLLTSEQMIGHLLARSAA